jgi:hypothetical protein
VVFEEFFHFEGGHATGTCGGDGLAVAAVLDVSAGEDAGDDFAVERGEDIVACEDVAVGVEIHHSFEGDGVGDVADAEEHEADGQHVLVAGDGVFEAQAFDLFFLDAENLFDCGAGEELDVGVGHGALEHDFGGAEFFGAVDERNFGGEAREEESFFHGGVAAANDGDLFAGREEAVAGGAGADAITDKGLLGGEIEPARTRSGGNDERAGANDLAADGELDRTFGEIDGVEVSHFELGPEADGLLLHVLDELGTLDAFRPAGEVFNQRGDGELAAGLVAFEDERLEVGAGGVDGGGQAGAPGAEDDCVACRIFRHMDPSSVNARRRKRMQEGLW